MAVSTQERLDILQEISKSWLELTKTITGLSDEQILKPGAAGDWSVKDIMAHITFWDGQLLEELKLLDRGETPPEITDFEAVNQEEAAKSRSASLMDVRANFYSIHEQVMNLLEATPHLSRDLVEGSTVEHYGEHAADIRAAFKK